MSRAWSVGGVVCLAGWLSGCGQPPGGASPAATPVSTETATTADHATDAPPPDDVPVVDSATSPAPATLPEWRTTVQLTPGTWTEVEQQIAEHRGKIVVVDVWSTACEPCLREFPHLIELQEKHPDTLVCVALNSDYAGVRKKPPEFYRDRVLKVLEAKQAKVVNVLCTEPADELFTELKIDSIPAVFVYDREGQLAAKFDHRTTNMGEFTYADHVEPMVARLLAGETAAELLAPADK
jgi:thiol-disulfide isomerase/thioredoxin